MIWTFIKNINIYLVILISLCIFTIVQLCLSISDKSSYIKQLEKDNKNLVLYCNNKNSIEKSYHESISIIKDKDNDPISKFNSINNNYTDISKQLFPKGK